MTRRRLLLAIIASLVAVTAAGWIAAPAIVNPTGVTADDRAVATMQVQAAQLSYSEAQDTVRNARLRVLEEVSGRGGSGVPGEGSLAKIEELDAAIAGSKLSQAEDKLHILRDVQQSLEDRYQHQTAAVTWFRTVFIGGVAVFLSVLGGLAAGGRAAGAAVNRLLLGADRAEDLASWMYELRAAKADMTCWQRWSNHCSLPALWFHAALRAWTEPLRAFIQRRARS